MLFNKTNNGTAELKALLGFLYASNNFDNIKTDIMLVEEDMAADISSAVMAKADTHYHTANYGTGGTYLVLDKLVQHIQLPVALYAFVNYSAHTDVSHGDDGRKVVIDPANQKLAWEWMIDRDDEAIINKAHKTTDRLLAFLEANAATLTDWKDSAERKAANGLFIPSTKIFNEIFPIDNSRRFFLKIVPFIKEAERKHLLPVLGTTTYDAIKAALEAGNYTDPDGMLQLIRVPLAYFTLSLAVKRLSVKLLPNGIFQEYISDRQARNATKPADAEVRHAVSEVLYRDATFELQNLQKVMEKLAAEALSETYVPESLSVRVDPDAKIMRL
jgi:hypothetical protein